MGTACSLHAFQPGPPPCPLTSLLPLQQVFIELCGRRVLGAGVEDTALFLKELPGVRSWGPGRLAWVGQLEGQCVPAAHWVPQGPSHSLVLTSDTPTLTLPSLVPWSMEA